MNNNIMPEAQAPNVQKEAKKDLVKQFIGILSALVPVLALTGYSLDWFTEDLIESFGIFLTATVAFIANIIAIWKNHYSGKKAQEQNKVLIEKGLK